MARDVTLLCQKLSAVVESMRVLTETIECPRNQLNRQAQDSAGHILQRDLFLLLLVDQWPGLQVLPGLHSLHG